MLQTLLPTLVLFLLTTLAMSLGVMLTGRSLRGSCGGAPGKACGCSSQKREACEAKAAAGAGAVRDDGVRHLDVVDED
jgi:hypothetical protein